MIAYMSIGLSVVALAVAGGTAWLLWTLAKDEIREHFGHKPADKTRVGFYGSGEVEPVGEVTSSARHRSSGTDVLFEPPRIGELTLWAWFRYHYNNADGALAEVVDDFYAKAAEDPTVAAYFAGYDIEDIKRKFLATFRIVADRGLNRASAEALAERHSGLAITGEAYDRTIGALVASLTYHGVPKNAIAQMVPMVEFLRGELVTA